jgi:hypothetical protein
MANHTSLLFATLLFVLVMQAATLPLDNKIERAIIVDSLDIAPVWAGHPVGFALLTKAPYQFIAYYDDKRQMTVGQRDLNDRHWTLNKLPVITG